VLVDEAHRSHTSTGHANLMNALPNCARIGFTGTPIIMRDQGRTTAMGVNSDLSLDQMFEDMLADYTPEQKEAIKLKYATSGNVLEAPQLIGAKARDMLWHYVDNILPNGFKAQVVASSRRATLLYRQAFHEARDELVAALEGTGTTALSTASSGRIFMRTPDDLFATEAFLERARPFLPTIRALEFAPVISSDCPHRPLQEAAVRVLAQHPRPPQRRPVGLPDRQVDAAHRLRCPGRAGHVPGSIDQGG
jgi:type I restriction enzyme R subunit